MTDRKKLSTILAKKSVDEKKLNMMQPKVLTPEEKTENMKEKNKESLENETGK